MFCPPPQQNKVPINRYQVRELIKKLGEKTGMVDFRSARPHCPGLSGLPLCPPEGPQFRLRHPGSRGHAGAMGMHGAEGEALGWGRGVRQTDERTEAPWGTAGHSTLLERRQPGR